jgi:hypothetical protein
MQVYAYKLKKNTRERGFGLHKKFLLQNLHIAWTYVWARVLIKFKKFLTVLVRSTLGDSKRDSKTNL